MSTVAAATPSPRAGLDRFLRLFADVCAVEGATALLLSLNVCLILMAYYVLKPVREALMVVFVGLTFLRLGPREFAAANALFALLWLLLAWRIGRAYRDLSVSGRPPATSASGSGH